MIKKSLEDSILRKLKNHGFLGESFYDTNYNCLNYAIKFCANLEIDCVEHQYLIEKLEVKLTLHLALECCTEVNNLSQDNWEQLILKSDLKASRFHGETALISFLGRLETTDGINILSTKNIELLIKGSDLKLEDSSGKTPLMHLFIGDMKKHLNKDIVKYALKNSNLSYKDGNSKTPLLHYFENNNRHLIGSANINYLFKKSNIKAISKYGWTGLMLLFKQTNITTKNVSINNVIYSDFNAKQWKYIFTDSINLDTQKLLQSGYSIDIKKYFIYLDKYKLDNTVSVGRNDIKRGKENSFKI